MKKHLMLIGFMGCGKTTVGNALSALTGIVCRDSDQLIQEQEGRTITEIFDQEGEAYFRDLETAFLKKLSGEETMILSCGGGMAMRPENARLMRECAEVIWLTASPAAILERVKDDDSRPLLRGHKNEAYIAELMRAREAAYARACDRRVDTDGKTPQEICGEILKGSALLSVRP